MERIKEPVDIMIDCRCDDIAEVMFFQDKQYGKVDEAMLQMEFQNLVNDIWTLYRKIYTIKSLKTKVNKFLDQKNLRFTLSCQN